jgi:hypothetical protein
MPSEWNMFVKKIYHEGKAKNSKYEFKQALKDASRRKHEMKHSSSKKHKNVKRKHSRFALFGGKTRRHRKH